MEENEFLEGIIEKVKPVKEVIDKVEGATGKTIKDIASNVGEKLADSMKEGSYKNTLVDCASKILKKED